MARPDAAGFSIQIDPKQWAQFKADLDKYDPGLAKGLRKRIRTAGNVVVDRIKETLKEESPDGGPNDGEGRAALIAATRMTLSFAKNSAGVKISTGSNRLPAEHKGLLSVYNKASFRHPVFGQNVYVTQRGRPYFGSVIQKTINQELLNEIYAAFGDASKAIGARRI